MQGYLQKPTVYAFEFLHLKKDIHDVQQTVQVMRVFFMIKKKKF